MLSSLQYRRIWKTAFLPIVDFGMLGLAASVSYWLRYKVLQENFDGIKKVYGLDFLRISLILSFVVVLIYAVLGLYRIQKRNNWSGTVLKLFLGILLVLLTTITFLFFNEYNRETLPNGVIISRFILGIVGFLAIFSVVLGRILFWSVEQILYLCGFFGVQIAVIGKREIWKLEEDSKILAKSQRNNDPKITENLAKNTELSALIETQANKIQNPNLAGNDSKILESKNSTKGSTNSTFETQKNKENSKTQKLSQKPNNFKNNLNNYSPRTNSQLILADTKNKFNKNQNTSIDNLEKQNLENLEYNDKLKSNSQISNLEKQNLEKSEQKPERIEKSKIETKTENNSETDNSPTFQDSKNKSKKLGLEFLQKTKKFAKKLQINFQKRHDIAKILNYENLSLKNLEFLKAQIASGNLAEIYLFGSDNPDQIKLEMQLANLAEKHKVSFIFCPSGLEIFQSFALESVFLEDKHFFELLYSPLFGWQIVFKRLFDIVFSFCFLIFFAWLYLIIAIFIKLESSGSIFYYSDRIGPNGQVFKLWKFRRLKSEFCTSEGNSSALQLEQKIIQEQGQKATRGALYKIKNDPRSTKAGQFLEKTSLDEIPQFINVLIGNMSIVGPRPHQPREVCKYLPHHYKVLNIQPGITGMAQINGRSDLSFEEEVRLDTLYVEKWSFWLDLWIILKTPLVLIFKKHK